MGFITKMVIGCISIAVCGYGCKNKSKPQYDSRKILNLTLKSRFKEATAIVDSLIAEDKNNGMALYYKGVIKFDSGYFKNSINFFERAYQLNYKKDSCLDLIKRAFSVDSLETLVKKEGFKTSIGIPIDQQNFDVIVKNEVNAMQHGSDPKIPELIERVRICNTIEFDNLMDEDSVNKQFLSLFETKKYAELFMKELHGKIGLGMSLHSKQYNIYWGGLSDSNSKFKIINGR
jgi:tetratricopeptide (TPR) repeat protein